MAEARRRALLLACTRFEDERLHHLRAPAADVEQLSEVLGDPRIGNFEVEPPLVNGSKDQIEERIEVFFDGAGPTDLMLLYLSGHGVVSESRQWFFATPKTKYRRYGSTAVSDTYIRERMTGSRSPAIVLVLDCCHSGLFSRSLLRKGGEDIHVEHRFEGRGRIALTASTEFQPALEGVAAQRPLSVFTELMIEGLRTGDADLDGDGQISISELYNYIAGRMPARSAEQTPGKAGDVIGEIVIASGRRGSALPEEIRALLLSPRADFRRAAIGLLVPMRPGAEPDVAHAVDEALARLAADDDPEVAAAARAAQGAPPAPFSELTLGLAANFLPPPPVHPAQKAWDEGKQLERAGDLEGAEAAYLHAVGLGRDNAQSAVERVRRKRFDLERAIAVHGKRAQKDRAAATKLARAYEVAGVPPPKPEPTARTWGATGRAHEVFGDLAAAEEAFAAAVDAGESGAEGALRRVRNKRSALASAEEIWGPRAARGDAYAKRKLARAYEHAGVTRAAPP
jgi:Caspase domain